MCRSVTQCDYRTFPNFKFASMASKQCHVASTPSTWPSERLRVSRGSRGGFTTTSFRAGSWAYAFGEPFPPQEKVKPEPVYPEIVSRVQFDDGVVDRVRKDFDQSKKLSTVLTRRLH